MVQIGLIGYGYWGPNLARNFTGIPECQLTRICDLSGERRARAQQSFPQAQVTEYVEDLLDDSALDAVVVATPVQTHFALAKASLLAGKDVLIEKPLTRTSQEAMELIQLAEDKQRLIAVDHTFLFTGAVRKMKQLVDDGDLGEITYIDSVRINLGLFQNDVNVLYDLAPHDLSIAFYLLDQKPLSVQAMGACHAGNRIENIGYLHLEFANNVIAHFHFNWLSPVKIRRTLIGGSKKMIVYDDMDPTEKVKVYDSGIVITPGNVESAHRVYIDYRTGDMVAPKLDREEALKAEAVHFVSCVRNRTRPLADGWSGLQIVQVLEAAQRSIQSGGQRVSCAPVVPFAAPLRRAA